MDKLLKNLYYVVCHNHITDKHTEQLVLKEKIDDFASDYRHYKDSGGCLEIMLYEPTFYYTGVIGMGKRIGEYQRK